jgi:hypothetical protein
MIFEIYSLLYSYFHRVHFKIHTMNNAPPGTHETSHSSGWSNSEKFIEFLDNFIHHVKPTEDKKVLLHMNNHENHAAITAIAKARENGKIILTFPPHTQAISSSLWAYVSSGPSKILQCSN